MLCKCFHVMNIAHENKCTKSLQLKLQNMTEIKTIITLMFSSVYVTLWPYPILFCFPAPKNYYIIWLIPFLVFEVTWLKISEHASFLLNWISMYLLQSLDRYIWRWPIGPGGIIRLVVSVSKLDYLIYLYLKFAVAK